MSLEGTLAVSVEPDAVGFQFTVTNAGTESVTLDFPSGQIADIAISSATGERWRWSDSRLFTQAIEPGHSPPTGRFSTRRFGRTHRRAHTPLRLR